MTATLPAAYWSIVRPGYYVTIKPAVNLVAKPFSLFDFDLQAQTMSFYYGAVGVTTKALQRLQRGNVIQIGQLLGKGFTTPLQKPGIILLLAAGTGIAPLHCLAQVLQRNSSPVWLFYNCTTAADSVITQIDEVFPQQLIFCAEQLVDQQRDLQEALHAFFKHRQVKQIYACGPWKYLQNLAETADQYQVPFEFPI